MYTKPLLIPFFGLLVSAVYAGTGSDFYKDSAPVAFQALDHRWKVTALSSDRAVIRPVASANTDQFIVLSNNELFDIEGGKLLPVIKDGYLSLFHVTPTDEKIELFRGAVNKPVLGPLQIEPVSIQSSAAFVSLKTNNPQTPGSIPLITHPDAQNQSVMRYAPLCLTAAGALLAGCQTAPTELTGIQQPVLQEVVEGKLKIVEEKSKKPSLVFRGGESISTVLRSLSMMDGRTYILEGEVLALPGPSATIYAMADLQTYFKAYGKTLVLSDITNSSYTKIKIAKDVAPSKLAANTNCNVKMVGVVPVGQVASDIAAHANLNMHYADTGSTAYASVVYPVSFQGPCANALEYIGKKSDLTVSFPDGGVEYRMMDTATIDIGIPLQNRKIAMDILADGKTGGASAGGASSGGAASSGAGSSGGGGSKSAQTSYVTDYAASIKALLDSTKSPFGTWNYVPETGHIFIRDRADAVAVAP